MRESWLKLVQFVSIMLHVLVAITLIVEVPIDNLIANWTEATLPPDRQQIRARWAAFHTLRTFLSFGAVAAAVAALTTRPLDQPEGLVGAPSSSMARSRARTP